MVHRDALAKVFQQALRVNLRHPDEFGVSGRPTITPGLQEVFYKRLTVGVCVGGCALLIKEVRNFSDFATAETTGLLSFILTHLHFGNC